MFMIRGVVIMNYSVCIFGDSVAKGVIFDTAKKKYRIIKDCFIHLIESKQQLSILNFAKFGCTITMGEEILRKHEDSLSQYDYVLLEFGGNDCDYNWASVAAEPNVAHQCNTPLELFREKYRGLIQKVIALGGHPIVLNLPPIDSSRYFSWISKGLDQDKIKGFLGDIESIHRWQKMYSDTVQTVAEEEQVPWIDIRSEFFKHGSYQDFICEDGIHPNQAGHQLISDVVKFHTAD